MRDFAEIPQMALRPPSEVMRLRRMGASFPTRLSFLRTLLRRLGSEGATVTRPIWDMSPDGLGHAVYSVPLGGHTYSLVAISNDLPADQRSDRVIAEAWDTAFVLYDGVPDHAEIARILKNAPLQEAGRFTERDLVLSRANKSVRLFDHCVERLNQGQQPDPQMIRQIGYLMRTTAVYGNGKFGIADRALIEDRPGLSGPFMAEMLTVWLIRGFTHDLAEHVGGAELDRDLKRHLGIGNATGLGMAPFLVSHPVLLNNWMLVRETALARVRAIEQLDADQILALYDLLERVAGHLAEWHVPDSEHAARIDEMRRDWHQVAAHMTPEMLSAKHPLDTLVTWSSCLSIDTQELLIAMILEPFGDLVDGLSECMADPFGAQLDPLMPVAALSDLLQSEAAWMQDYDFETPEETAQFWYVSEEKLEPRLGQRHSEEGAELESPLDIARQVQALASDLEGHDGRVGDFLRRHPEHRAAVRRVQTLQNCPYSEIRENLIADRTRPIDMLRCKLAFFGAAKFDPKSTLWTRIALVQGAPLADELAQPDDWWLASLPA